MEKKILFIGNSYTFFHEMPEKIFAPLARERGLDAEVTSVTRGGWYLHKFANPENEEGKRLRKVIAGKRYDCIVLQEQSLFPVKDAAAFVQAVKDMKKLLLPHTAHFVLYATWGRCDGSPQLSELSMTREEMTEHLSAAYRAAADACGMEVAEVGLAFAAYAKTHPAQELYDPDLSHPSELGSRLAAETILAAVVRTLGYK